MQVGDYLRSNRSRFITLSHAAVKPVRVVLTSSQPKATCNTSWSP
jgi:hypothetical protein